MRRILFGAVLLAAIVFAYVGGTFAASKTYQFTGVVKSADGNTLTVEKSAKETWTFEKGSDTKGAPKVGDRVTVYYKMVATEIESKPATSAPATKKK
jgi:hypothetical protein